MDITRVFVTKFLGVHLDFQLNWSKHISVITNKIGKKMSVVYRVRTIVFYIIYIVRSFCRILITIVKHGAIRTRVAFSLCILFRKRQLGFVEM